MNKLKVAVVVRNFSPAGGLELYAHKVIEGLLDSGHSVTVFCQTVESGLVHPQLSISHIDLRPRKANKAQRLQHDYDAGNKALQPVASNFDIVHSQHYPTACANVATFHNHAVLRWSKVGRGWEKLINNAKFSLVKAYKLRDFHDRVLCQNAGVVVFPSNVMKEDYFQSYPFLAEEMKPYVVAYPGASLFADKDVLNKKRGDPRPANNGTLSKSGRDTQYLLSQVPAHSPPASFQGESDGDNAALFTFLFVGRGYRRKGLDVLLEACSKLARNGEQFRLLIAGLNKKPLDAIRLASMGLSDRVEYLGFRRDMDAVYARAQAAVLPSRVEPFGMAPLQAAQFGLVPIVSRVSGASEVLHHEVDSLILENHLDAGELAQLMSKLINNRALTAHLSAMARMNAECVTWDETVENTLRAYELLVTQGNSRIQAALK